MKEKIGIWDSSITFFQYVMNVAHLIVNVAAKVLEYVEISTRELQDYLKCLFCR